MAHVFPPRAFKPEEIVDPQWLDKSLQPISEKVYGRINEQDIQSGAFDIAKVYVANGTWSYDIAAYTNKYLYAGTQDPGFGSAVSGASPDGWFNGGTDVDYSVAWQVVGSMTLDIEFNDEKFWICAMLQYATLKGVGGGIVVPTSPSEDPARVQFALRVDGLIIPETVTGAYIYPDTPKQMIYKGKATADEFDYRHIRYVQDTEGIGGAAKPVKLTYQAAVVEGQHTVDVVARRLPQSDGLIDNNEDGSSIRVFNKQLFVLVMNANDGDNLPQATASSVKPFDEAEVLSHASLFDNRISVVANRMNALTYTNTERGALRRTHLPRAASQSDYVYLAVGNPYSNYTAIYNSFGHHTSWDTVRDSIGNFLLADNNGAGWNLSTTPGWFIVQANVQLKDIQPFDHTTRVSNMGCFCIRIKTRNLGYFNVMGGLTEVYSTNDAFWLSRNAPNNKSWVHECLEDVPLFLAVDTDALTADLGEATIDHVEVSVAIWRGSSVGTKFHSMSTDGGTLTVWIQER